MDLAAALAWGERYCMNGFSDVESRALAELTAYLWASGCLRDGESIRDVSDEGVGREDARLARPISYRVEGYTVRALAIRDCDLTALPESIGQFTGLRQLDLRVIGREDGLGLFEQFLGLLVVVELCWP